RTPSLTLPARGRDTKRGVGGTKKVVSRTRRLSVCVDNRNVLASEYGFCVECGARLEPAHQFCWRCGGPRWSPAEPASGGEPAAPATGPAAPPHPGSPPAPPARPAPPAPAAAGARGGAATRRDADLGVLPWLYAAGAGFFLAWAT